MSTGNIRTIRRSGRRRGGGRKTIERTGTRA
jgi:hypothetical protein